MKLLIFVDLHASEKALESIKKKTKTENPDIICCSGDISIVDRGTAQIISELDKLGKKLLIIPGNHEDEASLEMICNKFKNIFYLHKRFLIINNILFLGYGTGGFSIIDNSFKAISKYFEQIIKKNKNKKIVLLTHAPPYKTKLDNIMGSWCGNKNLKEFIVKNKPDLVVCGHLHENAGKADFVGKSRIINPGAEGMIVKI